MRFFFKQLYTTFAWSYDLVAWTTSMGQWRTWQQAALIDFRSGPLLEIGHGPGHLLLDLASKQDVVFGIDASPQMTRIASRRLKHRHLNCTVSQAAAQALPFPDCSIGAVIATFPSEYIIDPETLGSVLRVLEPSGALIIIGLKKITGMALHDRFAAWLYRITGQAEHPQETYQPWIEQLSNQGFKPQMEVVRQPRAELLRLVAIKNMT